MNIALVGSWRVARISGNRIPVAVVPVYVTPVAVVQVLVIPVWTDMIPVFVIPVPIVLSPPVREEARGVSAPVSIDMIVTIWVSLTGGSMGAGMGVMTSTIAIGVSIVPGLVIATYSAHTQVVVITITPLVVPGTLRDPEDIDTISDWITGEAMTPRSVRRVPESATVGNVDPVLTILVSTVPVLDHTSIGGTTDSIFQDAVVPVLVSIVPVRVFVVGVVDIGLEPLICDPAEVDPLLSCGMVNLTSQLIILD